MNKVAIADVKPNPHQRAIRWERVRYYADKMKAEGYNKSYPITVDKNGVLVDGGHRVEAAKIAGFNEVPCVVTDEPQVAHSLRCNRDGADTLRDDVFDLAELCWRLAQEDWTGQQIADELGWSRELVTKHKLIKERLCPAAWNLARGTTNGHLVPSVKNDIVPLDGTNVPSWSESHFRALLAHLPYTDSVSAHNQIALIRGCFTRAANPKRKVTANWIGKEAQRYAWYTDLHRYAHEHMASEVPLDDKVGLLKAIYSNTFGAKPPSNGDDKLAKITRAVSALNERALGIKLYQDDALQRVTLFENDSIALTVNDPPYNVSDEEWDKIGTDEEYIAWTRDWLQALRPKLATDYHLFVFCSPQYLSQMEAMMIDEGWPLSPGEFWIWSHRNLAEGRDVANKPIIMWEAVLHCGTHSLNWPPEWTDERFAIQEHAAPQSNFKEGKHHPTAKPVSLIELFVRIGSKPGDIVLDIFAGGGTTGQACINVGQRQCMLIEKSPKYCKVIEERLNVKRHSEVVENGRN